MHIVSQKRIKEAMLKYPHSAEALLAWFKLMKGTNPENFSELKNLTNSVDKVGNYHVFNIGGNKLRLIVVVEYKYHKIFIKEILSHREYDKRKLV